MKKASRLELCSYFLFRIGDRNGVLCRNIADQGMEASKVIVEEQDRQRQKLLRVVRTNVSKDVEVT